MQFFERMMDCAGGWLMPPAALVFYLSSMPSSLLEWFQSSIAEIPPSVLLLDGGVSTFLEEVLASRNEVFSHRSLWSSSLLLDGKKQDVQDMHKAFQQAGADIVSTVTYQCHFSEAIAGDKIVSDATMTEMLQKGVQWAKQATKGTSCLVAASSGCYGGALADGSEYTGAYGDVSLQQLKDFHRRKFQVLIEEPPDAVAIETIPNLLECRAVVETLKEQSKPLVACWMSLACQDGERLNDGSRIEEALDIIHQLDPGAQFVHGIGINCCDSLYVPSLLTQILRHMHKSNCRRVIVVYPNSGEQWDAQQSTWKEGTGCTSPNEFANRILEAIRLVHSTWTDLEPTLPPPKMIVGGCCRTSPTTIAAIRNGLDDMNSKDE